MDEMIKIWLTEMLDREIKETNSNISNNVLWAHGSHTEPEAEMFTQNIASLEEYKEVLLKLKKQVLDEELKIC